MSHIDENEIKKSAQASLAAADRSTGHAFFSVSIKKLCLLYFFTFGIYTLVFFYQNWKLQKLKWSLKVSPVLRSVFAIFFVHSLFSRMTSSAEAKNTEHIPNLSLQATVYVVSSVASGVISNFAETEPTYPALGVASLILLFVALYPLCVAQKLVFKINDDKDGVSNSTFSLTNWIFIVLGALLWLTAIAGISLSLPGA